MLFSGKENVFMCLVAFQKKFRKIFSSVWKRRRKRQNPEKHGQNPKKKSSNPVKLREGRERGDWVRRGARSHSVGKGEIGAVLREIAIDAKARSRSTARSFSLCAFARSMARSPTRSLSFSLCTSVSSLCMSQFRKSFEVKIGTKMK